MKKATIIIVVAILLVAVLIFGGQIMRLFRNIGDEVVQIRHPLYYKEYVMAAAERHDVDPALVFAVVLTESSFRYAIISPAGAGGL
ncbi:MAG: transglycosylase SLT domain-containing protein, partial [Oscillospiraceae bacterium]|nr:transglycosylase SLT domain-containing protein [Oscillospiraceae bacterium]